MRILVTSIVDLKRVPYNRIHIFLNHLCQKHQIAVLCLNAWWLEGQGDRGARVKSYPDPYFKQLFDRVQIIYLTEKRISPVLQEILAPVNLLRLLRRVGFAAFDLHVNYSSLASGLVVTRMLQSRGIPTVFDIADDLPAAFRVSPQVPSSLQRLSGITSGMLFRANVRLATMTTAITKALQSSHGLPAERSVHLPNGFDDRLFKECPARETREKMGINLDEFVVGFVGTLAEWVDLGPIFVAVKRLEHSVPGIKLLIVGQGVGLDRARDLVAEYGIADRVLFAGHVAHEQVPWYISCMDACTIPFTDDALSNLASPIKLFEYMACGRPVVSKPLAGVNEAVGEHVLYATNEEEWGTRIFELYEDLDLRTRLGVEGREFVRDKYSWSKVCQRFENVLLETVGQTQMPSRGNG